MVGPTQVLLNSDLEVDTRKSMAEQSEQLSELTRGKKKEKKDQYSPFSHILFSLVTASENKLPWRCLKMKWASRKKKKIYTSKAF